MPQVEYVIRCDMSALQRRLYTQMKRHNVILTDDAVAKKSSEKGGVQAMSVSTPG